VKFVNESTAVEGHVEGDGAVHPRRFTWNQQWLDVTDVGRQWIEADGRHVLVMVAGRQVFELLLAREDVAWHIVRAPDEWGVV